jgi:hypothetical protein
MKAIQYTIRGVPGRVDELARQRAQEAGTSLNAVLLEALTRGVGAGDAEVTYHDLDFLAGTWVEDPAFDAAMEAFEAVDEDLWR